MQFLGENLSQLASHFNNKFSIPTVMKIGMQLLKILEDIHNKGLVHREIKPAHILVSKNDRENIFLIDFGL